MSTITILRKLPQIISPRVLKVSKCANYGIRNLSLSTARFSDRRYSDKHEWVSKDGKIATIGISSYAEKSLGDVVYVQLPEIGSQFESGEESGAVESVKAASEIYCPVSGKVTEVNNQLESKPGLVNSSCYEDGWLFRLEMKNESDYDQLMKEEDYDQFCKTEAASH